MLTSLMKKLNLLKDYLWTNKKELLFIFLIIYGFASMIYLAIKKPDEVYLEKDLIKQVEVVPPDYQLIKNQVVDLNQKNKDLTDALNYFKYKKQEVKYITKIETKLVGSDETFTMPQANYRFYLNKQIPIAEVSYETNSYNYKTYDLKIKTYTLISDKDTLVKVGITSSFDNKEYFVKSENIQVYANNKKKSVFQPSLNLGVGFSTALESEGIVGLSLLETNNNEWKFIEPTVGFDKDLYIGFVPLRYNIGKPLPLVNNLWIGLGYQTNFVSNQGFISLVVPL